ncbi:MAG: AAA family ATPase, partial [Muribaculaceae bacterium]|nr:AAA family ATPase [Muribaculaceae bacterium]
MDYPVAGFVFSTQGPWEYNFWEGDELDCLDEYSFKAATDRFQTYFATDTQEAEEAETDDEDLDHFLNRFIATEIGMDDFDTASLSEDSDNANTSETNLESDDSVTGSEKEESIPDEDYKEDRQSSETEPKVTKLTEALSDLVGLGKVKEKLAVYERLVNFNLLRSINGLPINTTPLHSMFLGSPGTGKTTVAKMLGQMLADAGVLSKGHLVIRERATLLGPNYSNEETNTLNAIEEAQGGILLIDEAYQLCQPNDPRDPGKFVIEALMTALADESKRDWMLILAGYPDEMKRMFDINPGFKSRIPEANIYTFEDFNESELMKIAEQYLSKHKYELTEEAHNKLKVRLSLDYSLRDKKFGNARHVINMIQTEILPKMAWRVTSNGCKTPDALSLVQAEDIQDSRIDITPSHNRIGFIA